MLLSNGGHLDELKETLDAGFPVLIAAAGIALVLLLVAALPPSALPDGVLSDLLDGRRSQVALLGVAICLSAGIVCAIVFWAL